MPAVLQDLSPEAHALQGTILDLGEVIVDERWDLNLPLIKTSVERSPTGMRFSFEELEAFASRVRQVIDGLFAGCRRPNRLPRRSHSDREILDRADMLIAAIDSSFWLVSADEGGARTVRDGFTGLRPSTSTMSASRRGVAMASAAASNVRRRSRAGPASAWATEHFRGPTARKTPANATRFCSSRVRHQATNRCKPKTYCKRSVPGAQVASAGNGSPRLWALSNSLR